MPTLTTNQGLILPAGSDNANVPLSFTSFVTTAGSGMENRLVQRYLSIADRTARNPVPNEGELSYLIDLNRYETYTGTVWIALIQQSVYTSENTVYSGMASVVYTTAGAPLIGATIVVPPSGQVRVDFSAGILDNTGGAATTFLAPQLNAGNVVGAGATLSLVTDNISIRNFGLNAITSSSFVIYTGLTPGASVNAYLLHRVDSGSGAYGNRKLIISQA